MRDRGQVSVPQRIRRSASGRGMWWMMIDEWLMTDDFMDKYAGFWWFVWWIEINWVNLQRNINYIHGIIMEATVNNIQVNVMTVANAGVVKETTYQKLKRLSKKYNLQTNDPKFARVWIYAIYAWHLCLYRCSYRTGQSRDGCMLWHKIKFNSLWIQNIDKK